MNVGELFELDEAFEGLVELGCIWRCGQCQEGVDLGASELSKEVALCLFGLFEHIECELLLDRVDVGEKGVELVLRKLREVDGAKMVLGSQKTLVAFDAVGVDGRGDTISPTLDLILGTKAEDTKHAALKIKVARPAY